VRFMALASHESGEERSSKCFPAATPGNRNASRFRMLARLLNKLQVVEERNVGSGYLRRRWELLL
jgi:hypothetical protein